MKRLDPSTVMLIKQIVVGVLVLLVVGGLLTGVWYGTRAQALTISSVEVVGGETISHDVVRGEVLAQLEGEYIGFIPRRFAWLYPKDDIVAVVSEVPRVHDVEVSRQNRTTLAVSFDEYVPFALWCESKDSDDCVFVDQDGFAFAAAPSLRGGALLRFSHLTQKPVVGTTTLDIPAVHAATELTTILKDTGWEVSHVEFDPTGDAYLHIVGGGEFKVSLDTDPAGTVDNLQTILASDEFSHLAPGNFGYVDLRFGNKVFVNENTNAESIDIEAALASSSDLVVDVASSTEVE